MEPLRLKRGGTVVHRKAVKHKNRELLMNMDRLSIGERVSGGSALLLCAFMFFPWYGLETTGRPNLLFDLHVFEDGGNAWQTLGATPILLVLVISITIGIVVPRLIGRDWKPSLPPGAVVCLFGGVAASLILIRIVFPPELGGEVEDFSFSATLEVGIFLSLAAAFGIAYGGYLMTKEEGLSFGDLRWRRNRNPEQLPTRDRGST